MALPEITPEYIVSADTLAGRETPTTHHVQMVGALTKLRDQLMTLRTSPMARDYAPAFSFAPLTPGVLLASQNRRPSVFRPGRGKLPRYDGNPESLAFATTAELGRLLQARKITSVALTEMYLSRLERFGPGLNCVVSLCRERALREAAGADAEIQAGRWRGPLHGIPYAVKDLFAALETRTTFGAQPYAEQVWDYDAEVVVRLKNAGAVLLGKLSMGELAMGDVWFGGKTRNPWKPTTGSSGSSAGSASAVAAGLCAFALGTETYGSIISPSYLCGTVGLRPTFGRVSRYGAMPLSWTMDKIGPICRSSEDCALVFNTIAGVDERDPASLASYGAQFSWIPQMPLNFWSPRGGPLILGVDEASVKEAGEPQKAVLGVLESLGVVLKPISLPEKISEYDALPMAMIMVEGAAAFAELAASGGFDALVQQGDDNWPNLLRIGATIPATEYIQAMRIRRQLQFAMAKALEGVDAYVTVTYKSPSLMYTNLTGHPTVITRCGTREDNLPAMIEFTGHPYREQVILHLAHAYEQATGFHRHWPGNGQLPETPPPLEEKA